MDTEESVALTAYEFTMRANALEREKAQLLAALERVHWDMRKSMSEDTLAIVEAALSAAKGQE